MSALSMTCPVCDRREVNTMLEQVQAQKVSITSALQQLADMRKVDAQNSLVAEKMAQLEMHQESQEIEHLMKRGRFEEAVNRACRSSHKELRVHLAEAFVQTLHKGVMANHFGSAKVSKLLGWIQRLDWSTYHKLIP